MPPQPAKSLPRRGEVKEGEVMSVVEGGGGEGGGDRNVFKVSGTVFEVEKRYEMIRSIGTGAYGVVMYVRREWVGGWVGGWVG